ncbi:hypothetical protein DIPPA_02127 [Diplonema papillatum]|nr:hypothetical protein DIPPA_02127 [Diplonema papillatum]
MGHGTWPGVDDVVLVHSLKGERWQSINGRYGVVEWTDGEEVRVVLASDEDITLGLENLHPQGVNVAIGKPVMASGLSASDWTPLNGLVGRVKGEVDELGRIEIEFPAPWGSVPLLLHNITSASEVRAAAPVPAQRAEIPRNLSEQNVAYMFREGTLVEAHGLQTEPWRELNGVAGIVSGGIVQEQDAARIPVVFPAPTGELPLLVKNVLPCPRARYVTMRKDGRDDSHGLTLDRCLVKNVKNNTAASRAGIAVGDRLRAVGAVPTFTNQDIVAVLDQLDAGSNFVVTLEAQHPTTLPAATGGGGADKWWGGAAAHQQSPARGASPQLQASPHAARKSKSRTGDGLIFQLAKAIDEIEYSNIPFAPADNYRSSRSSASGAPLRYI